MNLKEKTEKLFSHLVEIVKTLRSERGCPWDREQTFESMRGNIIEEAYETVEAIEEKKPEKIKEELGDLLLQVVFLSQIAKEENKFDISDVIKTITDKLIRRHPHVFGSDSVKDSKEVLRKWAKLKREERGRGSVLDGIPKSLPELQKAKRIQEKVSRLGFDWKRWEDVFEKVKEELEEVRETILSGNKKRIEEELGDLLFAVANLARFLDINPEDALRGANRRFIKRWKKMEEEAEKLGKDISTMDIEEMDALWEAVKKKGL